MKNKLLLALCLTFASASWAAGNSVSGEVLETQDAGGYTYVRLKTAQGETWAAVNQAKIAKGAKVNGVLSPYDGLSRGIIAALTDGGYAAADLPTISGQDAEVLSVKSMIAGEQYSTIFKDTRELAQVAVDMAEAILNGTTVETNDTTTYDNGVKVVPSYLLTPYIVTVDNYKTVLVDSGYIKEADLA